MRRDRDDGADRSHGGGHCGLRSDTRVFFSSTDANIPMSLGIPAITIGRGGPGARTHSLDEWTDIEPAANIVNVQRALALVLAVERIH